MTGSSFTARGFPRFETFRCTGFTQSKPAIYQEFRHVLPLSYPLRCPDAPVSSVLAGAHGSPARDLPADDASTR
ncbi:unnamed protein product [Pseudo-nitzschia multistriata]|uniref:Uncharacterized protein n=1 Tax=Pseudo-nitzschia multistriata TaxID=183589 RepID=A0A448ZES7_9STRA|nr:unnamed protein product [Pseudo-nitzschia multistriata]